MKVAFRLLLAVLLVGCGTEQERIASEARQAEEQRIKTELAKEVEQERLAAETKKAAEERARQEAAKRAEEERLVSEAREAEEQSAKELLKQADDARKQKEQEEAEAAVRKQKEKVEAETAARKQKEQEDPEAARKAKAAAERIERARQRKEQEDRIKKMAKELEIKEQTEDLKRRILKNADVEITALETATNLVAKISDKYAAMIQAAIRPNITFDPDSIAGNPAVEIQVRLAADGTILSISTAKPSGNKSWDIAAARALDKTERLPKDENGRVPPTLSIVLRPRER
jgi:colicin import membrane protein